VDEDLLPGKSIGRLAHEIQRVQFEKLRDGDFYYFENDPFLPMEVRTLIRNSRLSDIIKRNTRITNLQSNMFFTKACPGFSPTPTDEAESEDIAIARVIESTETTPALFPNPSSDVVTVTLTESDQSGSIQLFSARDGALVRTVVTNAGEQNIQINISDLPKGVYSMNITTGKKVKFIKLIKL
jgi:peroxidase